MAIINPQETYVDILLDRVQKMPERIYLHLIDDHGAVNDISYRHLFEKSLQYATNLSRYNLARQDRIVFILPTGQGFIYTYFASYLLAVCPVPA